MRPKIYKNMRLCDSLVIPYFRFLFFNFLLLFCKMVYQCTLETCSVKQWGWIKYRASIPGNALFLAVFSLLLLIQIYQGYRYRTYGVSIAICLGLAMEIAG